MLKLYNTYKSLILEATDIDMVMDAIENNYTVNITYDNGKNDGSNGGKRYCEVYNLGTTSDGNKAIRVFQLAGPNGVGWKTYRLDRIIKWEPTNYKYHNPVSDRSGFDGAKYNPTGDETLSWGGTVTTSEF